MSRELAKGFFGSSSEGSLEVRGARRERSELAKEAHWNSPRSNREVYELAGSPQNCFREFVGRPPEVRRKLAGRSLDLRTL